MSALTPLPLVVKKKPSKKTVREALEEKSKTLSPLPLKVKRLSSTKQPIEEEVEEKTTVIDESDPLFLFKSLPALSKEVERPLIETVLSAWSHGLMQQIPAITENMRAAQEKGEEATVAELMGLEGPAETFSPQEFARSISGEPLPSTKGTRLLNRLGQILGGFAALGPVGGSFGASIPQILGMAGAGQAVEELGGGGGLQLAAELATGLASGRLPTKTSSQITSKIPTVEKQLRFLEEKGYSPQQLQTIKSSLESEGKKIKAYPTKKSKETIESIRNKSKELIDEELSGVFEGIETEGGISVEALKQRGSSLYKDANDLGKTFKISKKNLENTLPALRNIKKDLLNTTILPSEKKEAVNLVNKMIEQLRKGRSLSGDSLTGETLINDYQSLNRIYRKVKGKDSAYLSSLKESIKETLRGEGKIGKETAFLFEEANTQWIKLKDAEKLKKVLDPAFTSEGINFTKLDQIISKPYNKKSLIDTFGKKQYELLEKMGKSGKSIANFEKQLEKYAPKSLIQKVGDISLLHGIFHMSPQSILMGLGLQAKPYLTKRLTTAILTDPNYGRLQLRLSNAVKRGSPRLIQQVNDDSQEYFKELLQDKEND